MTKDKLSNWMAKEAGITKKAAAAAHKTFGKAIQHQPRWVFEKTSIDEIALFRHTTQGILYPNYLPDIDKLEGCERVWGR